MINKKYPSFRFSSSSAFIFIPEAEARTHFHEYLRASEDKLVVVTRKGRPASVLLLLTDDELEDLILARSPKMRALLDKAWEDIKAGRGVEHDDFWKQFDPEISEPSNR